MQSSDKQILIVEDNKRCMEKACALISQIDGVFIHKAENSEQAYRCALEYHIDLFIVDIILNANIPGDVAGTKFVESIRKIDKYKFTPIIFTTSLEDADFYAYAHLHCYRYFEKPYDNQEFISVVKETLLFKTAKEESRYYTYKKEGVYYTIKVEDIVYFQNNSCYVFIHCANGTVIEAPYKSTRVILLELNSERFIKCNKNTIVNMDYVENIDAVNRYIELSNGYGTLELGLRLKRSFLEGMSKCLK